MWLLSLNEALHWSLIFPLCGASQVVQWVKNPAAMQGTQVRFLGQEDPLEKEMATHSSILAWRILWTEEPGGLRSMGSQESSSPTPQFKSSNSLSLSFLYSPTFTSIHDYWKKHSLD